MAVSLIAIEKRYGTTTQQRLDPEVYCQALSHHRGKFTPLAETTRLNTDYSITLFHCRFCTFVGLYPIYEETYSLSALRAASDEAVRPDGLLDVHSSYPDTTVVLRVAVGRGTPRFAEVAR
jgi:hypothetical protein